jgi:hypothetical protein
MRVRPRISVDVPDGWVFKEQLTLLAVSDEEQKVVANVIVSSEPVDPSLDSAGYAKVMGENLESEFPAYREVRMEPMTVFGGPGFLRRFEWEPEAGQQITQLQAYYATGGWCFVATATAESQDFDSCETKLATVLASLEIAQDEGDTARVVATG